MIRKGVSHLEAEKRAQKADLAFPDALVTNYRGLIDKLELPDEKDCHVLAVAIRAEADVIVTNNLKDFPKKYLDLFGIKAKSADNFITEIIELNPENAVIVFKEMVSNKNNPEMYELEVLESLRRNGLADTANCLHALL